MPNLQFFLPCLHTADESAVGRIDRSSLSDQSFIELLVNSFEEKKGFLDDNGDILEISEIHGLYVRDSQVREICFISDLIVFSLRGVLSMQWLPPHLKRINLTGNDMRGTFDCAFLPSVTRIVVLCDNILTGSVDLTILSDKIQYLDLDRNKLCGSLNLNAIPKNLIVFTVADNLLQGAIDLQSIERTLHAPDVDVLVDLWNKEYTPADPPRLHITLALNHFQADIRVRDIEAVTDYAIFSQLSGFKIVDRKGNVKYL